MKITFNKIWGIGIAGKFITLTSNDCHDQAIKL